MHATADTTAVKLRERRGAARDARRSAAGGETEISKYDELDDHERKQLRLMKGAWFSFSGCIARRA
jgi:hypothetical protein